MEQNIEQQVMRGLGQTQTFQSKSFPFATEQITLPSKGLCYPESNPLSKGFVTIKLLTAKEEDILTSTSLIRKGATIDRLLESIVVEPGVNVSDLLIGDKNAILVATRVLAYGPVYKVTVTDPFENEPVDVDVDMAKLSTKDVDESKWNRDNEYDFLLPKSKLPIKFKLLTHGDELAINKDIEASEKTLKQSNEITTRWRRIITEVNGNKDLGYISNFVVNQFQIQDSKALRNYIKEVTPDVDFSFEYTSPFTGEKEALRVPIGVDFFYPSE
jgi:hypothetical protein